MSASRTRTNTETQKATYEARVDEVIELALNFHPNPKLEARDFNHWTSSVYRLFAIKGRLNPAYAESGGEQAEAQMRESVTDLNGKTFDFAVKFKKEADKQRQKAGTQ